MRPLLLVIALLALIGCRARPLAEIVVVVDTNLRPGDELDSIHVRVGGEPIGARPVATGADLPGTLTLIPGSSSLGQAIEVTAGATLDGELVVEETVRTSFVEGPARELVIFLARRCRRDNGARPCDEALLCTASGCEVAEVPGSALRPFMRELRRDGGPSPAIDGAPAPIDAGADGGADGGLDGGPDAATCLPMERCSGADDDCDGLVDEARDNTDVIADDPSHCGRCGNACAMCVEGFCRRRSDIESAHRASCVMSAGSSPSIQCAGGLGNRYLIGPLRELEVSPTLHCGRDAFDAVLCRGAPFPELPDEPVPVGMLAGATRITVGRAHVCAIRAGSVYCAGEGERRQLDGSVIAAPNTTGVFVSPPASPLTGVTDLSAGNDFTCAVAAGGRVRCWGANDCSQLGRAETIEWGAVPVSDAVENAHLTGIIDVACAGGGPAGACDADPAHCCAVSAAGEVYCWGANHLGQVLPESPGGVEPLARRVSGLPAIEQIEVSSGISCGVDREGGVHCWGDNRRGLFADTAPGPGPAAVDLGGASIRRLSLSAAELASSQLLVHALALAWDGTAYCWGDRTGNACGDGAATAPQEVGVWTP